MVTIEEDHGRDSSGSAGESEGRQLRVALAMRGGVSLAVWIGGGDRRARPGPAGHAQRHQFAERRSQGCFERIPTRSCRCSRIFRDPVRRVGRGQRRRPQRGYLRFRAIRRRRTRTAQRRLAGRRGSVEAFHPQWGSARDENSGTAAVLRGDGAFYRAVFKQLLAWMPKKAPPTSLPTITDYLTVDLSATLQAGPPLPDRISGVDIRPRTAHFRFRKTPARPGAFNDMPARPDDGPADTDDDQRIRRLAYAARSTAPFLGHSSPPASSPGAGPGGSDGPTGTVEPAGAGTGRSSRTR